MPLGRSRLTPLFWRFLLILTALVSAPLLALGISLFISINSRLENYISESNLHEVSNVEQAVSQTLKGIDQNLLQYIFDQRFINRNLGLPLSEDHLSNLDLFEYHLEVTRFLTNLSSVNDSLISPYFVNYNWNMVISNYYEGSSLAKFEDSQFLSSGTDRLSGKWQGTRYLPLPRSSDSSGPGIPVLTLLRTIETAGFKGDLVVHLRESYLRTLMENFIKEDFGEFLILGPEGTVFSSLDKTLIMTDLSDRDFWSDIGSSPEGNFRAEYRGEPHFFFYIASEYNGWIYLRTVSAEDHRLIIRQLVAYLSAVALAILFISFGFSYMAARGFYRPFRKFSNQLVQKRENTPFSNARDELRAFNEQLDLVVGRQESLDNLIRNFQLQIREKLFGDYVHAIIDLSTLKSELIDTDVEFRETPYATLAIKVESEMGTREVIKNRLIAAEIETRLAGMAGITALTEKKGVFVLIVSLEAVSRTELLTQGVARVLEEMGLFHYFIGVGTPSETAEGLPRSYAESMAALNHACFAGEDETVYYSKLEEIDAEDLPYPAGEERNILQAIKSGDHVKVVSALDSYVELLNMGALSSDRVHHSFYRLLNSVLALLLDLGKPLKQIKGAGYNLFALMDEQKTAADLVAFTKELLVEISRYISDMITDYDDYGSRITSYIEDNYGDSQLCLTKLADVLEIKYSYLRRIFKEKMGQNFIDYLNRLRVDKSKVLLEKGNEPVRRIAERVGFLNEQSFYKFFKRYEGITPGKYRRLHKSKDEKNI